MDSLSPFLLNWGMRVEYKPKLTITPKTIISAVTVIVTACGLYYGISHQIDELQKARKVTVAEISNIQKDVNTLVANTAAIQATQTGFGKSLDKLADDQRTIFGLLMKERVASYVPPQETISHNVNY